MIPDGVQDFNRPRLKVRYDQIQRVTSSVRRIFHELLEPIGNTESVYREVPSTTETPDECLNHRA